MAIKYCSLCDRNVEGKRKVGVGSLIAILFTGFVWLLVIPFYSKRCPMCGNASLQPMQRTGNHNNQNQSTVFIPYENKEKPSIADELHKLNELKKQGAITEQEFNFQKEKILS
ncbi:SHOCT domain-containing protein [Orbus wheelerorum]|uniref:SHOCT domain-containing protein n=1 Tax=Orbus wheelerorum TaxID=3074111 RepID=UPI00370D4123